MDRNGEDRSSSNLKSRESTENRPHALASGIATGDLIQVNMARLADVLGERKRMYGSKIALVL